MNVLLLIAALVSVTLASEKRAITTCDDPLEANTWSTTCTSASGGTYCLAASDANTNGQICGCKVDADCISSIDYPLCQLYPGKTGGECVGCESYPGTTKDQHYYCRDRYPSVYLTGGVPKDTDGDDLSLTATEKIPAVPGGAGGFFREVCVLDPNALGSCQRCNQASPTNTPENKDFPDYPAQTGLAAGSSTVAGLYGTFHCGTIRPTRPICADLQYFKDSGIPDDTTSLAWKKLHTIMDIAHVGTGGKADVDRAVAEWVGACVPCGLIEFGKTAADGPTFFHELCSRARVNAPICKATGCTPCASNQECANGATKKSGFFTGGIYCFKDGHCGPCVTDADCSAVSTAGYKCQAGTCVAPVLCKENSDCGSNENCMRDGSCRTCTNNADCKSNDGGTQNDQAVCGSDGRCKYCGANSDCNAGAGGANCQATGQCVDCGSNAKCGALDGPGTITNAATDKAGQAVCNTATQICEDACASNDECTKRGNFGSFNRGNNCQADGTCQDCVVSPSSCGALDLGNESTCDTNTKRCYNPFTCAQNADCNTAANTGGGKNCQSTNVCISCTVTKTASTCGALDGGTPSGQPNCLSASRLCTDACTSNESCVGTQGANCMNNGVCFDCESDADCATGNSWGGDKSGQTLCDSATKLCVSPCTKNADCPSKTNCNKDGRCSACTTNDLCAANDGGEIQNQPICNQDTKQCGPCSKNSDCNADNANCGADGACYDCTDAGKSCGAADGGENKGQLNCDTTNGICVDYCTSDEQCTTDCLPHCNLDRGCCVECTKDADCPLLNWRNDEAKKTHCYDSFCTEPRECVNDDDCTNSAKPACSVTQGVCVECVFDDHCTGDKKACATNQQMCVTCVSDSYCDATQNQFCATDNECHDGAAALSFGVLAATVAVLYRLF